MIQLLILARDSADNDVREWLKDNKYMSHDIVNEQITIMGHAILRTLLKNIKTSKWFSVIGQEGLSPATQSPTGRMKGWQRGRQRVLLSLEGNRAVL